MSFKWFIGFNYSTGRLFSFYRLTHTYLYVGIDKWIVDAKYHKYDNEFLLHKV